jgi:hypothetical protein
MVSAVTASFNNLNARRAERSAISTRQAKALVNAVLRRQILSFTRSLSGRMPPVVHGAAAQSVSH